MLAGIHRIPERKAVAWNSVLLYDMIITQPVIYKFAYLRVPTVLMVGDMDTTAVVKDLVPPTAGPAWLTT